MHRACTCPYRIYKTKLQRKEAELTAELAKVRSMMDTQDASTIGCRRIAFAMLGEQRAAVSLQKADPRAHARLTLSRVLAYLSSLEYVR
jgi:hypothetical protein